MYTIAKTTRELQEILLAEADRAGIEEGFIKRQRKLSGSSFVQTVVGGKWANPEASSSDLNQAASAVGVEISRQGIDQRYGPEAAAVLRRVLEAAVGKLVSGEVVGIALLQRFKAIRLTDGSIISLPPQLAEVWSGCGEKTSGLKLSVDWDLLSGRLDGPHLAAARQHDAALLPHHQALQAGEVSLRDLGYFNLETFADIQHQGAYWVSYYKQKTTTTSLAGEPLDLVKHLPQTAGGTLDIQVCLGKVKPLKARLVAVRLPPGRVRKRRKHLREVARRKQQPISERALKLAQWLVIVTNIPASLLTLEEICVLLGCRWQIERLFRLWKEQGRIDEWRSQKPWHILCEIYAKLIACVLQHWICLLALWPFPDRSLHQASKTIRQYVYWLLNVLHHRAKCAAMLTRLRQNLQAGCKIGRSAASPHTYQRLLAFELETLN